MRDIASYYEKYISCIQFDVIVSPEARGLPLAGMISNLSDKPIVVMTKTDKFGPTSSYTYTRGYNVEPVTIHMYETFEKSIKTKRILFVDDGLASGNTTMACTKLIEQLEGKIVAIFVIVKHNYCDLDEEFEQNYMSITYNCYDLK